MHNYALRLPEPLCQQIKETAYASNVSVNQAIVWALEQVFASGAQIEVRITSSSA